MKLTKVRTHYTMTDNKLTDNEIIKGIECCASRTFRCDECCYAPFKFNECTPHILNDALDLINRQKAEIERLLQKLQQPQTEVIKDFAERLKDILLEEYDGDDGWAFENILDKLVKEMVGAE